MGLVIRGDAGGTPGNVEMVILPGTRTLSSVPYEVSELADGFTSSLTLDDTGWEYSVPGLGPGAGTVSSSGVRPDGITLSTLMPGERVGGVHIQGDNVDTFARDLFADRVSVFSEECL